MIIKRISQSVVIVTQRVDEVEGRGEQRDAIDQKLILWLIQAGFFPITIPNVIFDIEYPNKIDDWLSAINPEGLILSGGNDVGANLQRDATENYLLSWAQKKAAPVLGLCRGMQMMSTWAGGELTKVDGHVRTQHQLLISEYGEEYIQLVNSYHNSQLADCPKQFRVIAKTEDGVIEAMRHVTLPWEGWMWHPEREEPFNVMDIKRIKRLFCEKK